jgi:hypothetical protein
VRAPWRQSGRADVANFRAMEVVCADERAAEAEARRRMALESDTATVEWITLHSGDGQWVARRWMRTDPEAKSFGRALLDSILEADWISGWFTL